MRRDLIIGLIVSILIHGGVFFGDKVFNRHEAPVKKAKEVAPAIEIQEMPKVEPEEPEVVEVTDEPVKPMDFAPPMQADLPQLGPVMLAKKTGNPMLPFSLECRRFWRVGSWDDLQIPKPFSRVLLVIARPIYVEADGLDESLEEKRLQLQQSLDSLVERGRKWREEI